MNENFKKKLLELARNTITEYAVKKNIYEISENDICSELKEKRGVFVSLHKNGNLRGCIGYILPYKPLYIAVIENAYNAAFEDPRFNPVTAAELDDIEIEISVLSVPQKVSSYNEIEIGKHGIILKKGFYSAVFLPQVAPENNWDLETTLIHLSLKASGNPDLWKDDKAEFEIFTAEVFS